VLHLAAVMMWQTVYVMRKVYVYAKRYIFNHTHIQRERERDDDDSDGDGVVTRAEYVWGCMLVCVCVYISKFSDHDSDVMTWQRMQTMHGCVCQCVYVHI